MGGENIVARQPGGNQPPPPPGCQAYTRPQRESAVRRVGLHGRGKNDINAHPNTKTMCHPPKQHTCPLPAAKQLSPINGRARQPPASHGTWLAGGNSLPAFPNSTAGPAALLHVNAIRAVAAATEGPGYDEIPLDAWELPSTASDSGDRIGGTSGGDACTPGRRLPGSA